jgi:hypothetical protein
LGELTKSEAASAIAHGVTTIDHNVGIVGASGMVSVTSIVEVWLRPSGNFRVTAVVAWRTKGSRTVTVVVGAGIARTVIVVIEVKAVESSALAIGPTNVVAAGRSAVSVSVTVGTSAVLVDKVVDSITVTVWWTGLASVL